MCLEDIRLGRQIKSSQESKSVASTATPLIGQEENRVFIIFYPPPSGTITFSPFKDVAAGIGITLPSTGHPIMLDIKTHGLLVTRNWYAVHSVGGVNFTFQVGYLDVK